jgi:hypothetical protein
MFSVKLPQTVIVPVWPTDNVKLLYIVLGMLRAMLIVHFSEYTCKELVVQVLSFQNINFVTILGNCDFNQLTTNVPQGNSPQMLF